MAARAPAGGDPGQQRPDAPPAERPPLGTTPGLGEWPATAGAATSPDPFAERPQVFLGAAFAGGLVAAQLLKRLRR
jgi:hypothetical protein